MGKIVLFIQIFCAVSHGQSPDCKDFINSKYFKLSKPGDFKQYGQSKGIPVVVRKTYTFEIVFVGKNEYKMGIATESDYEPIHIRMIDKKTNKVLFDNKKYQYMGSVSFYIEKTSMISVEVTVLAIDEPFILPEDVRVCLGIKIYNQSVD